MTKNIAIVGTFNGHTECIGFLLASLTEFNVYVFLKKTTYNYCSLFKKTYKFNEDDIERFDSKNFDMIIILSANDAILNLLSNNMEKVISIIHHKDFVDKKNICPKYICLTPDNILYNSVTYMLSVYNVDFNLSKKKTIVYLGFFENEYQHFDLLKLIKFTNYKFIFIVNNKKRDMRFTALRRLGVEILTDLDNDNVYDIINQAQFLLIRKYNLCEFLFSGSIALALSFRKPLIIEKKYGELLGLNKNDHLFFEKNYNELNDTLNNLTDEKYCEIVNRLDIFCKDTISINKHKMENILKDINNVDSEKNRNISKFYHNNDIHAILCGIKIYWINLERNVERRNNMIEQFNKYNITDHTRICAIDGKNELNHLNKMYSNYLYNKREITKSEIACTLSHIKAIQKAYHDECDFALIIEDDCSFEYLQYHIYSIPYLFNICDGCQILQLGFATENNNNIILSQCESNIIKGHRYGTFGYVISRSGMKQIIEYNKNNTNIDVADYYLYENLSSYMVTKPYFSYFNEDISEIHNHKDDNIVLHIENKNFWNNYFKGY